jgi:hypothetical protein
MTIRRDLNVLERDGGIRREETVVLGAGTSTAEVVGRCGAGRWR